MNKQIGYVYSSSCPVEGSASAFGEEVELESTRLLSGSPGISIFAAESFDSVPEVEVDSYTGLPKLPIELPSPATSPVPVRGTNSTLISALKMSTSPVKRKSVTFESGTDQTVKKSMSKSTSASVIMRDDKKRSNGRPTSLPNRTRSVFIRLQPPRHGTPTTTHKRILMSSESEAFPPGEEPTVEDRLVEKNILENKSPTSSPAPTRWGSATDPFARRSSFMYQSEAVEEDDDEEVPGATGSHYSGEDYVTPYAQVLATLYRVRGDYLMLLGFPENTRTTYTRKTWTPSLTSPNLLKRRLSDQPDEKHKVAMHVLEELDWSLKMLETVNSNKSMGTMTSEKYKRLLDRELSHLSESSEKGGSNVAEWVNDITNPEPYDVNKTLGSICSQPSVSNYEVSLSASLSHDNWTRRKNMEEPKRRITMESEMIPRYGVDTPAMDKDEMKEYMNSKLYRWEVDCFHFNSVSGGNPLVSASYILFKKRNFFSEFQIPPHIFINYMTGIQNAYHSSNPYHNAIHATDVLLVTNKLINADNLDGIFTGVEVMAALVAAAVHDVDHPGLTNQFLVATRHDLAIMYNDVSVLENHHVATAFRTLQKLECNFLVNLDNDRIQLFRKLVIDMVLSTDMGKHIQHVAEMKTLIETKKLTNDGLLSLDNYAQSSAVLKCLIHCADLSNPIKPPLIAAEWSRRILDEYFSQGDQEKGLGIPVHAMGDKDEVSMWKCQRSFIDLIVYPLWETWAELVYPDAQHVLDNISRTNSYWGSLGKQEAVDLKENGEDGEDSDGEDSATTGGEGVTSNEPTSPAHERRSSYKIRSSAIDSSTPQD